MPKRRNIVLLVVCGLLAAALYPVFCRPREPSYQGRSLSKWMDIVCNQAHPEKGKADEAIRQIGTNATPVLIRWIQEQPPAWKLALYANAEWLRSRVGIDLTFVPREVRHGAYAVYCFSILGPEARGAIPHLTALLNGKSGIGPACGAAAVMPHLGEEALPALEFILTNRPPTRNQGPSTRLVFLLNLASLGPSAAYAAPVITQCLQDPDPSLRLAATNALRNIAPEALTNAPPR
jgi:hypothetical protein